MIVCSLSAGVTFLAGLVTFKLAPFALVCLALIARLVLIETPQHRLRCAEYWLLVR